MSASYPASHTLCPLIDAYNVNMVVGGARNSGTEAIVVDFGAAQESTLLQECICAGVYALLMLERMLTATSSRINAFA